MRINNCEPANSPNRLPYRYGRRSVSRRVRPFKLMLKLNVNHSATDHHWLRYKLIEPGQQRKQPTQVTTSNLLVEPENYLNISGRVQESGKHSVLQPNSKDSNGDECRSRHWMVLNYRCSPIDVHCDSSSIAGARRLPGEQLNVCTIQELLKQPRYFPWASNPLPNICRSSEALHPERSFLSETSIPRLLYQRFLYRNSYTKVSPMSVKYLKPVCIQNLFLTFFRVLMSFTLKDLAVGHEA